MKLDAVLGDGRVVGFSVFVSWWIAIGTRSSTRIPRSTSRGSLQIAAGFCKLLHVHDAIHVSQAQLPAGTKPTIDRDFIIASISAPSGLAAGDDEEEVEADEVARVGEED